MNMTWDLDILYKGYDDPKYKKDLEQAEELIQEIIKVCDELSLDNAKECIEKELAFEEAFNSVILELYTYSSLRSSTNVNDTEALMQMAKLSMMLNKTVAPGVKFQKFLLGVDLEALAQESQMIKTYQFILNNQKENASHMLSEKEEVLASKLNLVGSNSWSDLQSNLTSNLMIKVKGFDEEMPLSAVRNLAYSPDQKVRKNAYIAELNAYKKIDSSVAMALNNIKREVNIMMPLRGYKNALEKTLKQSHMSIDTLNAMIEAIKEEAHRFRDYFIKR